MVLEYHDMKIIKEHYVQWWKSCAGKSLPGLRQIYQDEPILNYRGIVIMSTCMRLGKRSIGPEQCKAFEGI